MDHGRLLATLIIDADAFSAWQGGEADQQELWDVAVQEGVDRLLASKIRLDSANRWAPAIRSAARDTLTSAAALHLLQQRELRRVTQAFATASIPMLVLKGAAWAEMLYQSPEARPRRDTDLMIGAASREAAHRELLLLGYAAAVESVMAIASAQRHYVRADEMGVAHHVDLHWRATNPLVFADLLPFARLWERSVELTGVGRARALCAVDALLHACLHRVAHHGEEANLMWLLDVHLLASTLSADEWGDVVRTASGTPLAGVCARTLGRAGSWLGTPLPDAVHVWIRQVGSDAADATFSGRGVSPLRVLVADWRAATWRSRVRLVKDHVFPPPSYILARYGSRRAAFLPLLYGRRAIAGLYRWVVDGR